MDCYLVLAFPLSLSGDRQNSRQADKTDKLIKTWNLESGKNNLDHILWKFDCNCLINRS